MSEEVTGRLPGLAPGNTAGHVLWLIRTGRARTRGDLLRYTGLSRSALGQRLEALFRAGYLHNGGTDESTGGRPSTVLEFNYRQGVVLAADFGATHGRLAVKDLAGQPLAEQVQELSIAQGPEPTLSWLDKSFEGLLAKAGRGRQEVRGMGIGVPGPVDTVSGQVRQPPIMPGWDGFPVTQWLSQRWRVPVLLDKDAHLMALGEHSVHYPDSPALVLVKVSTGIGAGLVAGGRLFRGIDGGAGDIGHVRVPDHLERRCRCGAYGCLAAIASGAALAAQLSELGIECRSSRDFITHLSAGQPDAVRLAREAGQLVGRVLATVVCLINPGVLVIAGDLAQTHFLTGVREELYQRALPRATQHLEITTSRLGDDAAITGAHTMVINSVFSPDAVDASLAAFRS